MKTLEKNQIKPAGLPRIIGSISYDLIIIIALLLFATTLLFFICLLFGTNPPAPNNQYFRMYLLVIITGYYHYSWLYSRQTIGMKAWSLVLLSDKANQQITLLQSFMRIIGGILGAICFGFGYIYLYFNKQQKTLADSLSKTKMYYVSH